jgi:hypothetical protein
MAFNIPTPMLMAQLQQQQGQGQQFQPYQGAQAAPPPNPMNPPQQQPQNPMMQALQMRGAQRILGPAPGQPPVNPMAAQAAPQQSNPLMGGMLDKLKAMGTPSPQYFNNPPTQTGPWGGQEGPYNGMAPPSMRPGSYPPMPAGYGRLVAVTFSSPSPQIRTRRPLYPNGPMPAGNQPPPFTPQAMTNTPAIQGIFPQWLQSLFH